MDRCNFYLDSHNDDEKFNSLIQSKTICSDFSTERQKCNLIWPSPRAKTKPLYAHKSDVMKLLCTSMSGCTQDWNTSDVCNVFRLMINISSTLISIKLQNHNGKWNFFYKLFFKILFFLFSKKKKNNNLW